jgi:hypothetical protein
MIYYILEELGTVKDSASKDADLSNIVKWVWIIVIFFLRAFGWLKNLLSKRRHSQ